MNRYERYVVGKRGVVPEFKAGMLYCHRCAKALWPSIDPADTDLSYFVAGRAYTLQPDQPNAHHHDEPAQCGHDV